MSTELDLKKVGVNLAVFKAGEEVSDADKEKIREYSKLFKIQKNLEAEIKKVAQVMKFIDSKWCRNHIWVNQQGEVIPIFDIDDSYLKNIYNWMVRNQGYASKEITKEYIRRFGIPETIVNDQAKFTPEKKSIWEDDDDDMF
jgi:hypothetical protein